MKNAKWHVIFWFVYFWYCAITNEIFQPSTHILSTVLFFLTHNLFLFYSYYFLLRFIFETNASRTLKALVSLAVPIAFTLLRYALRFIIIPWLHIPEPASMDLKIHFTYTLICITNYFIYAAGFYYFQSSIKKQKALTLAIEEKLTKEKENIQLENAALRAQINPHFLYNTLDFLYAKALPVSDELSNGVMRLSDIMRYSLKPQDAEGLVNLADEAEHIENIIEMNQLRFNNKLNVIYTRSDIPQHIKIIPLVLITLVENVFKHGVTNSPEHPARINIEITEANKLIFSTSNKKRTGPKEHSTGIGLNNTLKRLTNTYEDRCVVWVKDEIDSFKVGVAIQIV